MQNVGHYMLHLHVAQQLPPLTQSSWTSDLSPTSHKDAELNHQFPFSIEKNITRLTLKLRTKAKKPDIKFSQYT